MSLENSAFIMLVIALVAGCATSTPITPAASSNSQFEGALYPGETVQLEKPTPDAEVFRVFQQGATGFVSIGSVRSGVEELATQFCNRRGRVVRPIKETASKPPHVLGNFPRIEWLFECVKPPKATAPTAYDPDRLTQLERLKRLLDNGTITYQEFETEKAKVLNTPR